MANDGKNQARQSSPQERGSCLQILASHSNNLIVWERDNTLSGSSQVFRTYAEKVAGGQEQDPFVLVHDTGKWDTSFGPQKDA